MAKAFKTAPLIFIMACLLLSAWWPLHGNILFHTDIARDFLILEDTVANRHIPLIGARTGGIEGLFHGPLWFYLNLPAYILGRGNPAAVGWFWVLLSAAAIATTYIAASKIFGRQSAILSALLMAAINIQFTKGLLNPYGAFLLSPLFFLFFCRYIIQRKMRDLAAGIFILGLIIHFEIAFGGPLLLLSLLFAVFVAVREKRFFHIASFLILALPLSTYILFEVRHKFLQTMSVFNYFTGSNAKTAEYANFLELASARVKGVLFSSFEPFAAGYFVLALVLPAVLIYAFYLFKRKGMPPAYMLFAYFFIGYWLVALFFKGTTPSYFYIGFLPLISIVFSSTYKVINKTLFYTIFTCLLIVNVVSGITAAVSYRSQMESDASSWQFYKTIADKVFGSDKDFGYFVFTPDFYGYSPRYAMDYTAKRYRDTVATPFKKKKITYLLVAPPPKERPDINYNEWIKNDVNIHQGPAGVLTYNGFKIFRYVLTADNIKAPVNSALINSTIFR